MDKRLRIQTKSPYFYPGPYFSSHPTSKTQQARANSVLCYANTSNTIKCETSLITLKSTKRSSSKPKGRIEKPPPLDSKRKPRAKSTVRQGTYPKPNTKQNIFEQYENIYGICERDPYKVSRKTCLDLGGTRTNRRKQSLQGINEALNNTAKLPELYPNRLTKTTKTISPAKVKQNDVSGEVTLDQLNPLSKPQPKPVSTMRPQRTIGNHRRANNISPGGPTRQAPLNIQINSSNIRKQLLEKTRAISRLRGETIRGALKKQVLSTLSKHKTKLTSQTQCNNTGNVTEIIKTLAEKVSKVEPRPPAQERPKNLGRHSRQNRGAATQDLNKTSIHSRYNVGEEEDLSYECTLRQDQCRNQPLKTEADLTETIVQKSSKKPLEEIRRGILLKKDSSKKLSENINADDDSVLIGSERSSKANKQKLNPPAIVIEQVQADMSNNSYGKSPFAEMIDGSLSEYLGTHSFVSNANKSSGVDTTKLSIIKKANENTLSQANRTTLGCESQSHNQKSGGPVIKIDNSLESFDSFCENMAGAGYNLLKNEEV